MVQLLSVKGEKLVIWISSGSSCRHIFAALRLVPAVLFPLTGKHRDYSMFISRCQQHNAIFCGLFLFQHYI